MVAETLESLDSPTPAPHRRCWQPGGTRPRSRNGSEAAGVPIPAWKIFSSPHRTGAQVSVDRKPAASTPCGLSREAVVLSHEKMLSRIAFVLDESSSRRIVEGLYCPGAGKLVFVHKGGSISVLLIHPRTSGRLEWKRQGRRAGRRPKRVGWGCFAPAAPSQARKDFQTEGLLSQPAAFNAIPGFVCRMEFPYLRLFGDVQVQYFLLSFIITARAPCCFLPP